MRDLPFFPTDSADLVEGLVRLHQWAGRPALRRLRALGGTIANKDGEMVHVLSIATMSDVLNGKRRDRRPRPEFVDAFVTACLKARDTPPEDVAAVLATWRRADTAPAARPATRSDQFVADPDPSTARTCLEFIESLRSLKDASGLTYRELTRKAEANGDVLPHATLATALTRATLPRAALVSAFTRACGCGPEEVDKWLTARHRLATARPEATNQPASRPPTEPPPDRDADGRSPTGDARRHSPRRRIGTALLVCFLLAVLSASYPGRREADPPPAGPPGSDATSTSCPDRLRMGAVGTCVEEVQSRLVRAGLRMPVDGVYGPYTKMKVVVFQLYTGIPATGTVDEVTLRALRTDRTKIEVWPAERVERRLREVFPEEPDRVVALVRCLSSLDPHWVIGQTNGTRTWGLFQLSDREVVLDHQASHLRALDPEWNIQTAREIRDRTGGLDRWTCTRDN